MTKTLIAIFFVFFATSCNHIQKRGYSFELSDYELVKDGISNKETVLELMGSPTFLSAIGDKELWVYFSEDVRKFLFFKPKTLRRKIMTVSFDDTGIIDDISDYDLNDDNAMHFVSDYTEVKSHKQGFWSRIFGNIGSVAAN